MKGRRRSLAAAVALPLLAAAAEAPPEDPRALVGQPVLALASHPAVTLTLRQATGGRQAAVARQARNPGPGLRITPDGGFLYGWGCGARTGCGADGLFLALDLGRPQVFAVLFENGMPLSWVPPRASPWPAPLEGPLREFSAEVAKRMNFAAPR